MRLVLFPASFNYKSADGHYGATSDESTSEMTEESRDLIKHMESIVNRLKNNALIVGKNGKVFKKVKNRLRNISPSKLRKLTTDFKRIISTIPFELGQTDCSQLSCFKNMLPLLRRPDSAVYIVAHGDTKGIYTTRGDFVDASHSFTPELLADLIDYTFDPHQSKLQCTFKLMSCLSGKVDPELGTGFAERFYESLQKLGFSQVGVRVMMGMLEKLTKNIIRIALQIKVSVVQAELRIDEHRRELWISLGLKQKLNRNSNWFCHI